MERGPLKTFRQNIFLGFWIVTIPLSLLGGMLEVQLFMGTLLVCGFIYQIGATTFLFPPIASNIWLKERQNSTLEILLSTTIPPDQLIKGKLFSAARYIGVLIFMIIPLYGFVILCWLGVNGFGYSLFYLAQTIIFFQLILLCWILLWSTLSFSLSVYLNSALYTSIAIYGIAITMLIIYPVLLELFATSWIRGGVLEDFLVGLSLPHLLIELTFTDIFDVYSPIALLTPFIVYSVTSYLFYLSALHAVQKLRSG